MCPRTGVVGPSVSRNRLEFEAELIVHDPLHDCRGMGEYPSALKPSEMVMCNLDLTADETAPFTGRLLIEEGCLYQSHRNISSHM